MTRHPPQSPSGGAPGPGGPMAAGNAAEAPAAVVQTESAVDFQRLFDVLPGAHLVVTASPDHVVVAASDAYLRATVTERGAVLGQKLFDVFPDNPADPGADGVGNLRASLARAVVTGAPDLMPLQRYDIRRPGGAFEERWWRPVNTPVPGPDGGVAHVLHTVEDVTASMIERQGAVDALRAERDRSRGILESMAEGFVLLDRGFRIVEINAEGLRIDGRPREAIVNRHLLAVWPEAERMPTWPAYQRAMAERVPVSVEYRHASDGHDVWLDVRAYPVPEGGGGLAVFYRDITDRKQAEARLRASEARLRFERGLLDAVLRQAPVGISVAEAPSGRALMLNDKVRELIGHGERGEDARRYEGYGAVHPDGRPYTVDDYPTVRALRRGEAAEQEEMLYRRDGPDDAGITRLAVSSTPVRDEAGRIVAAVTVVADVEQQRRAEAALREGAARLRALVSASSEVLYSMSPDWSEMRQLSGGGFLADTGGPNRAWLEQYIHPDDQPRVVAAIREAVRTKGVFELEHRVRRADGSLGWTLSRAVPLLDPAGAITEWFGAASDVTARKEAEAALHRLNETLEARVAERTAELRRAVDALHAEVLERERAEEQLRQAQKMEAVGQLTGGIAHDFNNMLQVIGGGLEMLWRRVEQGRTAEAGRHLEGARKTVERAAALTHRLLAFARRQALQPKPVEPDALVAGMAELIRRTVGAGVEVELHMDDGIWAVLCDPNQLENALLNLAINARDAMPEGGRLTICTKDVSLREADVAGQEGAKSGDYVEIAVTDTGTGMDEATRARAFEPFFTTKPIGQGTGLGLSQIYGFVQQSGGIVRLDSAPGQGTTVRLYLPRHGRAEGAAEVDGTAEASRGGAEAGAGATVLLVEDEAGVRDVAAERLRELGYRVMEAADGPAALRALSGSYGTRVDLLVTDVGLPGGLNGRQVADMARESRPGLPVLFITGYAGDALEAYLAPGMAVIGKPFTLDALTQRVRAMLNVAPAR